MKKTVAFKTLGCRLNQYETDAIASEFQRNGYRVVPFREKADAYVINTCTVTGQSDHKSFYEINRAARLNPSAVVVVTGCLAESETEKLKKQKNIAYVVDNGHKHAVFSIIESHFNGEIPDPAGSGRDVFGFGLTERLFHTRSFIKIQDGCDHFCTFCIVPFVRGRAESRPVGEVLDNIRDVIRQGAREIVLTGVNIGRYESEGVNFEGLLERILDVPGDFRLRISSIEPYGLTGRFYGLFAHPKLAPHLHLCLQSGSDTVLRRMRRMYAVDEFLGMMKKLRAVRPDFNFTTDIMVGFPGETEEDFDLSCRVVRDAGFSHIHTFKYSLRQGTKAALMEDQIPEKVKTERSRVIRLISLENRMKFLRSMMGKEQLVLAEKIQGHTGKGYGEHFVPVRFTHGDPQRNKFYRVTITGVAEQKDPFLVGGVS